MIFDLDGLLVDSEPLHLEAERRVLAGFGVTSYDASVKAGLIGRGSLEIMQEFIDLFGLSGVTPEQLQQLKTEQHRALQGALRGFEPTVGLAKELHQRGYRLAVASGSVAEFVGPALRAIGLAGVFSTIVTADDVAHGKPSPDLFLEAAARLGADPADCVVLEDSAPGVAAAVAAGMRCIAIPSPAAVLPEVFRTADLLIGGGMATTSAQQLMTWIDQLPVRSVEQE